MSAALIVRRKQVLMETGRDPFGLVVQKEGGGGVNEEEDVRRAQMVLKARSEQAMRDRSLLSLMSVLQKSEFGEGGVGLKWWLTSARSRRSRFEWTGQRPRFAQRATSAAGEPSVRPVPFVALLNARADLLRRLRSAGPPSSATTTSSSPSYPASTMAPSRRTSPTSSLTTVRATSRLCPPRRH